MKQKLALTRLGVLIALLLFCFSFTHFTPSNTATAAAGINHQINFQGKLVNTDGTNVTDGSYSIVFSLYSVASAGSAIWTETQSTTVTNGIFQVNLGSVTTLPGSIDFNTDNIYLGIKVGADAEMTPRIQFTSVPQAFNSEKLGGLDKTGFIQNSVSQQASSNFNISGAGVIGTTLTTPTLQSAAATALTITGNAASTWSTSAGNITLQAGGGTISLGSTTTLSSTGALTITGGTTLALTSTSTNAISLDSGTTGAVNIGTGTGATKTIQIGNTGTSGIAETINIGNATGTSTAGITIGSVIGTSSTAINGGTGTGAITLTPGTAGTIVIGATTGTGQITLGSSNAGQTVVIGSGTGVNNVQIANDPTSGNTVTIAGGATATTKTDTVNIATGNTVLTGAKTVHIADGTPGGSGANTVLIGSAANASAVTLTAGTGNINLQAATIVGNATTQNLFNTVATTLNFGGAAATLNIGPGAATASSILLAGGSAATGCTVDGATGNLACSGTITGGATTTVGYFTRTGTTLQPATGGDNIQTTAGGTITSAGILNANATGQTAISIADSGAQNSGITIGTDTNLYRSAASTLKTDDAFIVSNTSASAFRIQNASNAAFLVADTLNSKLEVTGNIYSQGLAWTSRSTTGNDNLWSSVAYGNSQFVAVSKTSFLGMNSPDGINWTAQGLAGGNAWSSVTYGNGLFVTVACGINSTTCNSTGGNRVNTSPDGVNWTSRSAPGALQWSSVTYGNNIFVAVATDGTSQHVMSSPDGINWTARNTIDNTWNSVTYGNGLFVAVSSTGTGNRVMTSPDGINWTIRTSAADNTWNSVTYGNGLFVAVSSTGTGNRVMTSPDGINWTIRTSAADNTWNSVAYGNGLFVAVSSDGTANRVMTSGNTEINALAANNTFQGGTTVHGSSLFQSDANSATAFQIQNAAGNQLLNVDTATNNNSLLTNPSVEQAIAGNWTNDGSATTTQDATQHYIGSDSLKIITTAVAKDGAKQPKTLANSTAYALSFEVKLDAASAAFATLQAGYSSTGLQSGESPCALNTITPLTTGWTRITCTFTTAASNSGTPYIFINQSDATAHTFYIDAIQLQTGSTLTAYQDGLIAINGVINSPTVFQNAADSNTAFQVQNAAGTSLFNVNTRNGRVEIAPNTSLTFNGSGTNAQINYNAGGFLIGNYTAAGYTYVQSDSFRFENTTDFSANLTLNNNGEAIFKNRSNSTVAFQIQNAAGTALLTADTTGSVVTVNQGNFIVAGLGTPATPSVAAGSNQGGSLSGAAGTTYFYKVSALTASGESLPSAETSIAASTFTPITAPTALTAAATGTAGNVTCNATGCNYKVTFTTANGETTGGTTSNTIVNVTSKTVSLTAIPVGSTGTTSRKIYRSTNGGAFLLCATIADNTTVILTDNTTTCSGAIPGANTARTNTNNATVTFTPIAGASTYRIYRGTVTNTENAYQTTAASPFTDTGAAGTAGSPLSASTVEQVGIGVATPQANLHVAGNVLFKNVVDTTAAFSIQDSSATSLFTADTANLRVGIGTSAPGSKLEVVDTTSVTTFLNAAKGVVNIMGSVNNLDYDALTFSDSNSNMLGKIAALRTSNGSFLEFGTSNNFGAGITNTGITIDPAGKVGIGNAAPGGLLDARTTAATSGIGVPIILQAQTGFTGNAGGNLLFSSGANGSGGANGTISFGIGSGINTASGGSFTSGEVVRINANGSLRFFSYGAGTLTTDASGNVTAASDERLKDIQGSFSKGLDTIEALNPILYNWNSISGMEMNTTYAGFSAQNVQSVLPEAIGVDARGYLSLQDRPIMAASVNAIKELNARLKVVEAVTGNSPSFADLNVSGLTTVHDLVVTGTATVATLTVTGNAEFQGNITVGGHIITAGSAPIAATLAATGQNAIVAVEGNDTSGTITITTGDNPAAGMLSTLTFHAPYGVAPRVVLTAVGITSAASQYYYDATPGSFDLGVNSAPLPHTTYKYSYFVTQ